MVKPGISAHKLLLGGPSAIAVAPAGFHADPAAGVSVVGVIDEGDPAARGTAESLAGALGAEVAEHGSGRVDLLVVGSRPEAPDGRVVLSAKSDYAVEAANYPVLVIPRGVAVDFGAAPPRLPLDDDDHGRDLRVAAVDPLGQALEVDAAGLMGRGELGDGLHRAIRFRSPAPPVRRRAALVAGGLERSAG